jgi:hypothetical protein
MSSDPRGFALEEEDMEHWAYEYAYKVTSRSTR